MIEAGDFVRSTLVRSACGLVVRRARHVIGRDRALSGYVVRLASGREDFIPDDLVELIAFSEAHLARLTADKGVSDDGPIHSR